MTRGLNGVCTRLLGVMERGRGAGLDPGKIRGVATGRANPRQFVTIAEYGRSEATVAALMASIVRPVEIDPDAETGGRPRQIS